VKSLDGCPRGRCGRRRSDLRRDLGGDGVQQVAENLLILRDPLLPVRSLDGWIVLLAVLRRQELLRHLGSKSDEVRHLRTLQRGEDLPFPHGEVLPGEFLGDGEKAEWGERSKWCGGGRKRHVLFREEFGSNTM
jgi:hypothetical protein